MYIMYSLPEKPPPQALTVPPQLAVAIGLEAAVMLSALAARLAAVTAKREPDSGDANRSSNSRLRQLTLETGEMQDMFPFWQPRDIRRIETELQQLGMLQVEAVPEMPGYAYYRLDPLCQAASALSTKAPGVAEPAADPLPGIDWRQQSPAPAAAEASAPGPIPADWSPSPQLFDVLQLSGIDEAYARSRVGEFILYWQDRKEGKHSWNATFFQFVKRCWNRQQTQMHQQQGGAPHNNYEQAQSSDETQQRIQARLEQLADRSWAE